MLPPRDAALRSCWTGRGHFAHGCGRASEARHPVQVEQETAAARYVHGQASPACSFGRLPVPSLAPVMPPAWWGAGPPVVPVARMSILRAAAGRPSIPQPAGPGGVPVRLTGTVQRRPGRFLGRACTDFVHTVRTMHALRTAHTTHRTHALHAHSARTARTGKVGVRVAGPRRWLRSWAWSMSGSAALRRAVPSLTPGSRRQEINPEPRPGGDLTN